MFKTPGYITSRFYMFMLFTFTVFTTYAQEGSVLNRKIRITKEEGTRYELLRHVTEETGYSFIYNSNIVNNDEKINIANDEYTVREAIYLITGNHEIEMRIVGNHIALNVPSVTSPVVIPPPIVEPTPRFYTITGTVFDLYSKERVSAATITLSNSSIGTITNQEGVFRLAIPDSLINEQVIISHIGYENKEFPVADNLFRNLEMALEPKIISLQEVVIRVINPLQILEKMLVERSRNYSSSPSYMTTFYREGIEHKKKNVNLTEAVLKVYKTGNHREITNDQVKLLKMRRTLDYQEKDSILTRVKSGIFSTLQLDLIKYTPDFLTLTLPEHFDYQHTDISVVNNRLVYVISFTQKKGIKEPLFQGDLYIDTENYALVEARFEINPEYVEKATTMFVEKRARDLRLTIRKAAYIVSYRPAEDGIYYINQVRGDLEFKVKRRRHLFNSTLRVWFEMVNCKTDTHNVIPIPRNERLSTRSIFSETHYSYDAEFWGNFNVIVPEKELKDFIINSGF